MIKYLIPILVLLTVLCLTNKNTEYFQDYKLWPFGEVLSGTDPLYFYNYNRYRKPYRWPFRYFSSYPYSHMSPLK